MATRRSTGTRPEVVRCPYCGEDYSVTYKRCPFCDGKPAPESSFEDDPPAEGRRSGGKRLVSNTRGGAVSYTHLFIRAYWEMPFSFITFHKLS